MGRDEFSKRVKEELAKRVAYRCSNPHCLAVTTGPRSDPEKSVNIGVAAHITAAAEGGPRYERALSNRARGSIDNAIWLCQNCAKLIDNDEAGFSADLVREWKARAEARARAAVKSSGGGSARATVDPLQASHLRSGDPAGDRGVEVHVSSDLFGFTVPYTIDPELPVGAHVDRFLRDHALPTEVDVDPCGRVRVRVDYGFSLDEAVLERSDRLELAERTSPVVLTLEARIELVPSVPPAQGDLAPVSFRAGGPDVPIDSPTANWECVARDVILAAAARLRRPG